MFPHFLHNWQQEGDQFYCKGRTKSMIWQTVNVNQWHHTACGHLAILVNMVKKNRPKSSSGTQRLVTSGLGM